MRRPAGKRESAPTYGTTPLIRRRCDNCGGVFQQKRPNQRFCTDKRPSCKSQFHYHGSAFGKLKENIEKFIRKEISERFQQASTAALIAAAVRDLMTSEGVITTKQLSEALGHYLRKESFPREFSEAVLALVRHRRRKAAERRAILVDRTEAAEESATH